VVNSQYEKPGQVVPILDDETVVCDGRCSALTLMVRLTTEASALHGKKIKKKSHTF
jgi:hypothetical protein